MANITPTIVRVPGQAGIDGWQVKWGPMANGDIGLPVGSVIGDGASAVVPSGGSGGFAGFADKSAQWVGTGGVGLHTTIEGSNDGTNWIACSDPTGVAIDITTVPAAPSGALKAITEAVVMVRPHVSAGDGTTSLTVTMFFRKTQTP